MQLIETAVEISELLYAEDSTQINSEILQRDMDTFRTVQTATICTESGYVQENLFAFKHAPTQFEIVNPNTEHEETLFGQAKDLAQRATNRQPSTVVPQILLRIQAKQKSGSLYNTYYQSISRVSKAVEELNKPGTPSQNTLIQTDFLTSRMSSWQLAYISISEIWSGSLVAQCTRRLYFPRQ